MRGRLSLERKKKGIHFSKQEKKGKGGGGEKGEGYFDAQKGGIHCHPFWWEPKKKKGAFPYVIEKGKRLKDVSS